MDAVGFNSKLYFHTLIMLNHYLNDNNKVNTNF